MCFVIISYYFLPEKVSMAPIPSQVKEVDKNREEMVLKRVWTIHMLPQYMLSLE